VKLLLDENLSPTLVARLALRNVDAWHTRDRGLNGAADHVVWRTALAESRVLVTINTRDFLRLAAREVLHGGLITLPSGSGPEGQWRLLMPVIEWVQRQDPGGHVLLNQWVAVDERGAWSITHLPVEG
jgi:hypothetical protein